MTHHTTYFLVSGFTFDTNNKALPVNRPEQEANLSKIETRPDRKGSLITCKVSLDIHLSIWLIRHGGRVRLWEL